MKNIFQTIFFLILVGCSSKNYSIEKEPVCNSSQNNKKLSIYCSEYNERYYLIYDNFEKTFFNCKKNNFDISINNESIKKSYLECYLKNSRKKFIFLDQSS